jgi:hypothetical protein
MLDTLAAGDRFKNYMWSIVNPAGQEGGTRPTGFSQIGDKPFHLSDEMSTLAKHGITEDYPVIKPGAGDDATASFRWLPYVAGKITFCRLGGTPILTGPMSGCWLTVFRMGNATYFGHLGTSNEFVDHTNAVKNNWKIAVGTGKITPLKAFDPSAEVDGQVKYAGVLANGTLVAMGLSDPQGGYFTVETKVTPVGLINVPRLF